MHSSTNFCLMGLIEKVQVQGDTGVECLRFANNLKSDLTDGNEGSTQIALYRVSNGGAVELSVNNILTVASEKKFTNQ
ncbi:hypothetical protein DPX16_22152 [Anabarilius grahami]|uniref:Uncharacterized protein n=1 Tax=Anabarilius grahami TaxID=495550 RepID=A0A3N0XNL5_ANAGA|nr:hypothetical protein DPX16_22152 [Anabarilius grahami]